MPSTASRQPPQPVAARVPAAIAGTVRAPARQQRTSAPLLTVLHWQTTAGSGMSAGDASCAPALAAAPSARPSSSARRSAGTGVPRSKSAMTAPTLGLSPSRMAPVSRSSRITSRA